MVNEDTAFEPSDDVVIRGAGFSGSLTALYLLADTGEGRPAASTAPLEKNPAAFVLSVPAGKMGAFPQRLEDEQSGLMGLEVDPDALHAAGERLLRLRAQA